ncbi:MAG TPA: hypothetical protein VHG32_07540 [Thermoanaerobaculia bacterium]|jgi:hypothetical protein|nr:hypothetical protein [Thermoanaerobaculia bacterium]
MKIQEQDKYHGPALMQIVEHDSFKALNKADGRYGHYLVNKDIRLWFKYSSAAAEPWQFTFRPGDLRALQDDADLKGHVYVVLVCGYFSVCCLSWPEICSLIDPDSAVAQWVKVGAPQGKQMRVTGSAQSKEPLLIPHNKFPNCIF